MVEISDITVSKATHQKRGFINLRVQGKDKRAVRIAALRLAARLLELGVDEVTTGDTLHLGSLGYRVIVTAWGTPGDWSGAPRCSKWIHPGPAPKTELRRALQELPESSLSAGARTFIQ